MRMKAVSCGGTSNFRITAKSRSTRRLILIAEAKSAAALATHVSGWRKNRTGKQTSFSWSLCPPISLWRLPLLECRAGLKGHQLRSDVNIFQNCHFSCGNSTRKQRTKNGINIKDKVSWFLVSRSQCACQNLNRLQAWLQEGVHSNFINNLWMESSRPTSWCLTVLNPTKAGIAYDAYVVYNVYVYIYNI